MRVQDKNLLLQLSFEVQFIWDRTQWTVTVFKAYVMNERSNEMLWWTVNNKVSNGLKEFDQFKWARTNWYFEMP